MKKSFLIFSILFINLSVFSQMKNNAVVWSETLLTWKDYKGRPNRASSFQALTAAGIEFSVDYSGSTVTVTVINAFDPKKSWTKNKESKPLLAHEQLHFDITEVYARKLRKELAETRYTNREQKLMNQLSKMYNQQIKDLSDYQRRYDKETDHSIIVEKQKSWENRVAKELKELDSYSEIKVVINLKE